jgi:FkbM family methyltransferase
MSLLNTIYHIFTHPLNKGQASAALIRFVKWQLASRIFPNPIIYSWINGSKIIIYPGETGLTGNLYCGLHEFVDMTYLLHVANEDDLFIDCGANVGSYTILACAAKGAKGYCFEPVPSTFARLVDNIKINNLGKQVTAINSGLSEQEGELVFTTDENCMNHVVTNTSNDTTNNTVKVKVLALDNVLDGKNPSIMKIDVEGFETLVLKGSYKTLQNDSLHSVILELNGSGEKYGFSEEKILKLMNDNGFSTYIYEPFSRELKTLNGNINGSGNTLFIRNEALVKNKLKVSPEILIGSISI